MSLNSKQKLLCQLWISLGPRASYQLNPALEVGMYDPGRSSLGEPNGRNFLL